MSRVVAAVFMVLAIGTSVAHAQSAAAFGVKAGVNFANVSFDGPDDPGFKSRTGLVGGVFAVFPLNSDFGIQTEALFSQRGAQFTESGATAKLTLTFLEIPVMARFSSAPSANGVSFHAFAGPSFGFRLKAKLKFSMGSETEEEDLKDDVASFSTGLVGGGGVDFGRFVVDGRYHWGLTNLESDSDSNKIKNKGFSIMAGIRF